MALQVVFKDLSLLLTFPGSTMMPPRVGFCYICSVWGPRFVFNRRHRLHASGHTPFTHASMLACLLCDSH